MPGARAAAASSPCAACTAASGTARPTCRSSTCPQRRARALSPRAASTSALGRPPVVGQHAAVVEERQRRQRAAEQQAVDEHERQHADDPRAVAARNEVDRARGRTRRSKTCAPAPRRDSRPRRCRASTNASHAPRIGRRSPAPIDDVQITARLRHRRGRSAAAFATAASPAPRRSRRTGSRAAAAADGAGAIEAAVVPHAACRADRQPRLIRIDFPRDAGRTRPARRSTG